MRRQIFIFLCLGFLFLQGCTHRTPQVTPEGKRIEQIKSVPSFAHVNIKGLFDVNLKGGYARPQVILRGDPRDLAGTTVSVRNQTLLVHLGEGYPDFGRITVEIHAKNIQSFSYQGTGVINISRINTPSLDLFIDNKGKTTIKGGIGLRKVDIKGGGYTQIDTIYGNQIELSLAGNSKMQLTGKADIRKIELSEGAFLSFYWVNSKNLCIRAKGESFLQLAGIAERMNVELFDKAHFNGRYLRAKRAFVKTFGQSRAEISAVNRQHTLASDGSDIYFYNIPEMRADFMAFNGSVLDMRDWRMPFLQEYDRYNK